MKNIKWIDLSRSNVALTAIKMKQLPIILVNGDINQDQFGKLVDLGFREIKTSNATVMATTRFSNKQTNRLKFDEIPFEEIGVIFPDSSIGEVPQKEIVKFWDGYADTTKAGVISTVNSARTERALNSYERIGINENNQEIMLTNSKERFYFKQNDNLVFSRKEHNPEFLSFLWGVESDYISAAKGLLLEMTRGQAVTQFRLDQLVETSALDIRVTSKAAADIQGRVSQYMTSLLLADQHSTYNKKALDIDLLTNINDAINLLPKPERANNTQKLAPAFSYITRKYLEAIDNCTNVTLVNDSAFGAASLIPSELPIRLCADKDDNVNCAVFSEQFGKIKTNKFEFGVTSRIHGEQIILDAHTGQLSEPSTIDTVSVDRADHLEALAVLASMNHTANAMVIIGADDAFNLGNVDMSSMPVHSHIFRNFNVVTVFDVAPIISGSNKPEDAKRVYLVDGKRDVPSSNNAPTEFDALYSIQDIYDFSDTLVEKYGASLSRVNLSQNELLTTTSISDILSSYTSNQREAGKYDLNFAQTQYTPLTSLAVANDSAAVPRNFVHASREAAIKLVRDVGNPDTFILKELGLSKEHIQQSWDAEQIDALTMGIWRLKNGKPFLEGDATGKGKGRVLAGLMYWSAKNGKTPVFMTSSNDLLSDIWRDVVDCNLDQHLDPFFMMSDGEQIIDKKNNIILMGKKEIKNAKTQYLKSGTSSISENAVFTTFSQINRLTPVPTNKKQKTIPIETRLNERAKWLTEFVKDNNAILIIDESHNVASITNNQASVLDHIVKQTQQPLVRSSATWSKDSNNIAQCADLFPPAIDAVTLKSMVTQGGTGLQEVLSTVLIAEGAMVRREHNYGKRQVDIVQSQQHQKNKIATDVLAGIMQIARTYATKQFEAIRALTEHQVANKNIEEYSFASSFGLISEGFTNSLRASTVVECVKDALARKEKPIIGVDKTAESSLKYLLNSIKENEDDKSVIIDHFPDFKTMLTRWVQNEGTRKLKETIEPTAEEIAKAIATNTVAKAKVTTLTIHWKDELNAGTTTYAELEKLERSLLNEVAKMPDLPLSPIDYVKDKLGDENITVSEVSGRSLHVRKHTDGKRYIIENRTKETKAEAQFAFNSNQTDAIILTRSGTEGISLHADSSLAKFGPDALNRRHIMLMGSFFYIVDEEQFYGRGERKGQVVPSRSSKIVTGMPIEARLLALSERNRLKLSASTTGNSQSLRATSTTPNILNNFGDEVTAEYLAQNPEVLRLLGFEDAKQRAIIDFGAGSTKSNQITSLSGSVLGRMMLLEYQQQNSLLDDLGNFYQTKLAGLQSRGIDPLNTKLITGNVKVVREKLVNGTVKSHYDSEFDKPVIGQTILVTEPPIKLGEHVIRDAIKICEKKVDNRLGKSNAKLEDLALELMVNRDEILNHLLIQHNNNASLFEVSGHRKTHYTNINEAIQDTRFNRIKSAALDFDTLVQILQTVEIGGVYSMSSLSENSMVITDIDIPKNKQNMLDIWRYSFTTYSTNGNFAKDVNAGHLYSMFSDSVDILKASSRGNYSEDHPINAEFRELTLQGNQSYHNVLVGNMIEASRLNAEKKLGSQVVIEDSDTGSYLPAVRLKADLTIDKVMATGFSANQDALDTLSNYFDAGLATNQIVLFEHVTSKPEDGDKKQGVVIFGDGNATFEVKLPKTKAGRYSLYGQDPFQGLQIGVKGVNKKTNIASIFKFKAQDLNDVFTVLQKAGFNLQISARKCEVMEQQLSAKPQRESTTEVQMDIEGLLSNDDDALVEASQQSPVASSEQNRETTPSELLEGAGLLSTQDTQPTNSDSTLDEPSPEKQEVKNSDELNLFAATQTTTPSAQENNAGGTSNHKQDKSDLLNELTSHDDDADIVNLFSGSMKP